jgi:hypothetical protein
VTDPDPHRPFACQEDGCRGTVRRADVAGLERGDDGARWVYPPGTERFRCDQCGALWFTWDECGEEDVLQAAATQRPKDTP